MRSMRKKTIRTFKGLQVVEAEADLILVPTRADLACATRGDTGNCVFAQYCKRCFESQIVEIFKNYAYIDLPDAAGKRYLKRFVVPLQTNAQIEGYDSTGKLNPGGYRLRAPAKSQTLDVMAKGMALKRTPERAAKIKGERNEPSRQAVNVKRRQTLASKKAAGIRSGVGLVHFKIKRA